MKVTIKTGHGDCVCCGYYEWIVLETSDGISYYADNHISTGLPNDITYYGTPHDYHSWAQGYIRALKDMGMEVDIEIEEVE